MIPEMICGLVILIIGLSSSQIQTYVRRIRGMGCEVSNGFFGYFQYSKQTLMIPALVNMESAVRSNVIVPSLC